MNAGFDKPRSRRTWALPVLLLGALAVWGIFALGRGRSPTGVTARQPALPSLPLPELPKVPPVAVPHIEPPHIGPPEVGAPQAAAPQAGAPQTAAPQAGVPQVEVPQPPGGQQIALPGGATLNVDPNGPQAYLARSLADSAQALPQTFQFDKLTFDTGAATLSADSDATKTIDDVATVLKAYPESHVRVVGHTDDRGDPAANEALSEARAKTVQQMLVERGVAADRIETGSKSDTEAVTGNDTEEGRTRNRRADVVLLSR